MQQVIIKVDADIELTQLERAGELMSDGTFTDLEVYSKLKCD